ncbi:MAG: helix-turn-helix domain-containing protein [Chloroflexi bacterium]|nr:helix-turn-helix domain-containing protein [Chloroflexota bacterium]
MPNGPLRPFESALTDGRAAFPTMLSDLSDLSSSERIEGVDDAADAATDADSSAPGLSGWLTIGEASNLIGVSEATLRRWAEAGDVPAFVTPGGHRRFSRQAILRLLPPPERRRRTLRELGETPERIVRQYRRELASATSHDWMPAIEDDKRRAFRGLGRRMLEAVLAYLDAEDHATGERVLRKALTASGEYGRLARANGLTARETAAVFVHFRTSFLEEIAATASRRRLELKEAVSLMVAATTVFDRLLLRLLDAHGVQLESDDTSLAAEPER